MSLHDDFAGHLRVKRPSTRNYLQAKGAKPIDLSQIHAAQGYQWQLGEEQRGKFSLKVTYLVGFPETGSQAPQTQCHNRRVGHSDAWTLSGPTVDASTLPS